MKFDRSLFCVLSTYNANLNWKLKGIAVVTSVIRAKSLFYNDCRWNFILGDRGLTRVPIRLRFQRWYSFSTNSSRFPPLRNIFLEGRRGGPRFLFILNLPHQGGNGGTSLPSNFLFSFFSPLLPFHSLLIFRSHPFVTLHYLLLRNVEDSFSLRCAGKISGTKSRFAISSIHKRNESTNFLRSMAEYDGREYDEYPIDRLRNNPRN